MNKKEKLMYEKYLRGQQRSGIKTGDTVKVLRTVETGARGWDNAWVGVMNDMVGRKFTVKAVTNSGIQLKPYGKYYTLGFPYFVLEKVS